MDMPKVKVIVLAVLFLVYLNLLCGNLAAAGELEPATPSALPVTTVSETYILNPAPASTAAPTEVPAETDPTAKTATPTETPVETPATEAAATDPESATPLISVVETADPLVVEVILTSPIDAEIQHRIFHEACGDSIDKFCAVMAIAHNESRYQFDAIGDEGKSYGYLQIKIECHLDRLARYGFTPEDMFDPVKCTIIALDYLEELAGWPAEGLTRENFTHQVLIYYNMGPGNGGKYLAKGNTSSPYSREVMERFERFLSEAVIPV